MKTEHTNYVNVDGANYEVCGTACKSRSSVKWLIEKTGAKTVTKFDHHKNGKTTSREIPAHQFA